MLGRKKNVESQALSPYVGHLKPQDLARCPKENLLEALRIQERLEKEAKEKTKREQAILKPLHEKANQLQAKADALKQELAKAQKLTERLDIQEEIRATLKARDAVYHQMETVKMSKTEMSK